MDLLLIAYICFFLCWGSFLNVVAYRLVHDRSIVVGRSSCPHCNKQIAWYDLIPVLSWCLLRAHCRFCHQLISPLYPSIELFTAVMFYCVYAQYNYMHHDLYQLIAPFVFISALIVTIRSDVETMLISRYVTLFLIPVGICLSALHWTNISVAESVLGAVSGYSFLYLIGKMFTYWTGKQGIGQGDVDLLAFIGSFIGVIGWWFALLIGSFTGSIIGALYIFFVRPDNPKIPFGPFLAAGALLFIFFEPFLIDIFFSF